MSAGLALQEAILAALSADVALRAIIGTPARIFDDVPRDTLFPYLTIGDGDEIEAGTATEAGSEHRITLHAWSRYAGRREVKLILERVRTILHDANLTITGNRLINLRCEAMEFTRATDGRNTHGLARIKAMLEAN